MAEVVGKALYGGNFAVNGGVLPFVLPGEQAGAQNSPQRVAPGCIHFGVCGGCQYQHAAYPAQVEMKLGILRDVFAEAGLSIPPDVGVHTADPWGYRNRIRLRVESGRAGYSRRGSNEFLPVTMCPIAAPVLWRVVQAMLEMMQTAADRMRDLVSEVEVFCSADESRVQAQIFLREPGDQPALRRFCDALSRSLGAFPELAGVGAVLDPELNRRARRGWPGADWGAPGLLYHAAGREYWVARGAFFQVNRFLIDRLVEQVCGGRTGELAWDLFAGVGLFTRELAAHHSRVVAVEGGEAAATALAAASRGGREFTAVHAATLDFLRAAELQRERPELVVLDPPRAGLGAQGAELLARIGPAEIVYVSCDPITLARDLAVLVRAGYEFAKVDLVDLFPQTFHMETVVHLQR